MSPAVGFAADAAARYHGGLGVAVVTYGAGAFNLVNAVAGAYAERSPVVVIAGAPGARERASGFLLHHQARAVDTQLAVFREITCDQAVLTDPATAPAEIARVLAQRAASGRCRSISSSRATWWAPRPRRCRCCRAAPPIRRRSPNARTRSWRGWPRPSRPVIIVDVEIRRYGIEEQVAELARKLGLPVVTTFMGRGLLGNAPDVVAGTYLGAAGDPAVTRLVEDADVLLLLGVILSDTNFALSHRKLDPRRTMLAIDRSVRIGHHVYPDLPLDGLVDALDARAPRRAPRQRKRRAADRYPRGLKADDQPIAPSDIACAINDLFDRHGPMPMTADIGDCLFTAMEIENTALAAPGYYAGMGFGVPAGIGVAAATGRRPLILVGDGAFQMTGWELGNCRRYGLDPIVVLFNNCSWEMLRVFQPEFAFNDLDDWNFAAIAPSLGGHGERVTTRRRTRRRARARGRAARRSSRWSR